MPTAVSLFSGCGGSDYGLHAAGFNVLMANDVLKHASIVYKANLPETDFHLGDVAEIKKFPNAELLAGCYPCQGFSQGGVRDPTKSINYLYREFDRALRAIKPKAFVVENVSGMIRADFSHLLRSQLVRYRLAGYRVTWQVVNALNFGLAQERKRIFLVGIRSDIGQSYEFPKPTHGEGSASPYLNQKAIIGEMSTWPTGEFYDKGFHWYYLSRNRYRAWDEPSKTIVSNERHVPLHPMSPPLIKLRHNEWAFAQKLPARRLSFREAALLQGFPKSFIIPEELSLKKKYEIVGNAVPPPLFQAVVSALPPIWD